MEIYILNWSFIVLVGKAPKHQSGVDEGRITPAGFGDLCDPDGSSSPTRMLGAFGLFDILGVALFGFLFLNFAAP